MDIIDGEPYDITQYENHVLNEKKDRPKEKKLNGRAKENKSEDSDTSEISTNTPIPDTEIENI